MSTRPHARLVSLDVSAVRKARGVACVLTADDIPGENDASPAMHDDPVFAVGEVQYVGQSLFAVGANSIAEARAAAALAKVEYEDLPAVISVDDALQADLELSTVPSHTMRLGDADAALAAAPQQDRRDGPCRRPGSFLSRRADRLRGSRRRRGHAGPFLDPASDRGPAHGRQGARRPRPCRHHGGAPHGRRLRRQGEPGLSDRRDRGRSSPPRREGPQSSDSTATTTWR